MEVLRLLDMKARHLQPDLVTQNLCARALRFSTRWAEALQLTGHTLWFGGMRLCQVPPSW